MSIDDLSLNEITVLYWKCKGLKYEQIAQKLGYGVDWVQLQMSTVYAKLGFKKEMHATKRRDILEKEICPQLPKDLKDWKAKTKEEIREEPKPPDPEMMALVLYDEMILTETKEKDKSQKIIREEPRPIVIQAKRPPRYGRLIFLAIFLCLVILAVGYGAYMMGKGTVAPTVVTAITQVVTEVLPTSPPSPTLPPTTTPIPTETPTEAPPATSTPKDYYDQGEAVYLKENVYAYLNKDFIAINGSCGGGSKDFGVTIDVVNDSSDQFLLRFNTGGFHAIDDLGTEYPLAHAGMRNFTQPPGIDITTQMGTHDKQPICVIFDGLISLKATYVLITADWISGVEHLVFRKDI